MTRRSCHTGRQGDGQGDGQGDRQGDRQGDGQGDGQGDRQTVECGGEEAREMAKTVTRRSCHTGRQGDGQGDKTG